MKMIIFRKECILSSVIYAWRIACSKIRRLQKRSDWECSNPAELNPWAILKNSHEKHIYIFSIVNFYTRGQTHHFEQWYWTNLYCRTRHFKQWIWPSYCITRHFKQWFWPNYCLWSDSVVFPLIKMMNCQWSQVRTKITKDNINVKASIILIYHPYDKCLGVL